MRQVTTTVPDYDPRSHHRRSIRLPTHDYASAGAYFVTVVTYGRRCLFGHVEGDVMRRNRWGEVVADCWTSIPRHFRHVVLDEWVVMPNHLHGILIIHPGGRAGPPGDRRRTGEASADHRTGEASAPDFIAVGAPSSPADASPLRLRERGPGPCAAHPRGTRPGSIGAIIQNVKSVSARRIRADVRFASHPWGLDGPRAVVSRVWHRNYYERVIRDARGLERIRWYIRDNPRAWATAAAQH